MLAKMMESEEGRKNLMEEIHQQRNDEKGYESKMMQMNE